MGFYKVWAFFKLDPELRGGFGSVLFSAQALQASNSEPALSECEVGGLGWIFRFRACRFRGLRQLSRAVDQQALWLEGLSAGQRCQGATCLGVLSSE